MRETTPHINPIKNGSNAKTRIAHDSLPRRKSARPRNEMHHPEREGKEPANTRPSRRSPARKLKIAHPQRTASEPKKRTQPHPVERPPSWRTRKKNCSQEQAYGPSLELTLPTPPPPHSGGKPSLHRWIAKSVPSREKTTAAVAVSGTATKAARRIQRSARTARVSGWTNARRRLLSSSRSNFAQNSGSGRSLFFN